MADWWKVGRIGLAFGLGGPAAALGYARVSNVKDEAKRTKGEIEEAYGIAKQRLGRRQRYQRQDELESLNARGLLNGGASPIGRAMTAPSTIADAERGDLEGELGLDRRALDNAHTQALNKNKADELNAYIDLGKEAISNVASFAGAGSSLNQMASLSRAPAATRSSPIASALLSGSSFDGIHPVNPLGDDTSSWYLPEMNIDGSGMRNADFNTHGVG